MKPIISRESLREQLMNVLAVEIKARQNYDSDIHTFTNFVITNTILKIRDDEDRHIRMLHELVELLEKK